MKFLALCTPANVHEFPFPNEPPPKSSLQIPRKTHAAPLSVLSKLLFQNVRTWIPLLQITAWCDLEQVTNIFEPHFLFYKIRIRM